MLTRAKKPPRRSPRFGTRRLCWVLALTILSLACFAPAASAAFPFGTFGTGAGQTDRLEKLAVDTSTGNVYVADAGNNRIDVFDSAGEFVLAFGWGVADGTTKALQTCTTTCFRGIAGSGPGQLDAPNSIAVDNDPASPAYRDVYVIDDNLRVQKFSPSGQFLLSFGEGQINLGDDSLGVGPDGTVFVGDSKFNAADPEKYTLRILKFEPTGVPVGSSSLVSGRPIADLAIGSSGSVFIGDEKGVKKYEASEPTATLLNTVVLPGGNFHAMAVDSSENLFVAHFNGDRRVITEYSPSGDVLKRFGFGQIEVNLSSISVSPTGDGILGSEGYVGSPSPGNRVIMIPIPPPGPIACCAKASPIGNTQATLNATVNPEGKETTVHFEYVDDAAFKVGGFESPATKSTPEAVLDPDFSLHTPDAQVSVDPGTTYHFRIIATNADGEAISSGEFTSLEPLEIGDTWSTEVGTDAAQLHAEVNPLGIPTTAYFQYVDDATYRADVEASGAGHGFDRATDVPDSASPIDVGFGEAVKRVTTFLYPLAADTTYHYRVIAEDSFLTVQGQEHTLRTFPLPSTAAEDCPNQALRSGASANLPDCRAYEMVSPVDKNGNDIRVNLNFVNYLAGLDWAASNGNRFSYSSSTAFAGAPSGPWTSQYMAIRDPVAGWSTHAISPPREPESIGTSGNIALDLQYKLFSKNLANSWLLHDTGPVLDSCGVKGFLNLYRRDEATGAYEALTTAAPSNEVPETYWPELLGVSADGSHALFRANGRLTKDASTSQGYQLYEHVAGKNGCGVLRLVSVLTNGKADVPIGVGTQTGEGRISAVQHIISEDGSRIFWADRNHMLYVRLNGKETVPISAGPAHFVAAAADGSRALFTESTEGEFSDLYEFDVGKAETHLIAEGTRGSMAGVGEDASHLYFVSQKDLAEGAEAGKPNLYLHVTGGATSFVATLVQADVTGEFYRSPFNTVSDAPVQRGARITPDGAHLAFVSKASLTSYDNKDEATGEPNLEVYLYDAGTGKLACISCNPSGARPKGQEFAIGLTKAHIAAELPAAENQFSFPRALSEDGNKLFFNSYEALVPRDTNGKKDVYEWERSDGAEGCEEAGAELYVASSGGCLSLISSGQSPQDSEFDDASPDGHDVFIKTVSSLLPQDDGLIDIYDAREGGGYPPPPITPPACEGEACQGPLSPPNDPTPASSAFEGAGNVVEKPAKKKTHRAKKKTHRAKKKTHRKHAKKHTSKKHKRANHERRAGR